MTYVDVSLPRTTVQGCSSIVIPKYHFISSEEVEGREKELDDYPFKESIKNLVSSPKKLNQMRDSNGCLDDVLILLDKGDILGVIEGIKGDNRASREVEPKKFLEDGEIPLRERGWILPLRTPKEVSRASKEEGEVAPMVTR